MPKRTNVFQKIIYMLQRELAGQAEVTESKLLQNQDTGAEVEVDIVVETCVSQIPLLIGIECTATKRRANIEWIHQIYGKHRALPVQATVVVSKSGYTKNALKQAEAFKMLAMTLEEAESAHWDDIVEDLRNLSLASLECTIRGGTAYYDRVPPSAPDLVISQNMLIKCGPLDNSIQFSELATAIIRDSRTTWEVMSQWIKIEKDNRPDQFSFTVEWKPRQETTVICDDKFLYRINQLDLQVTACIETTPVSLSLGKFGNVKVAFGAAENIFRQSEDRKREVVVTMTRSESGLSSSSIMIPKFEGDGDQVFNTTISKDGGESDD